MGLLTFLTAKRPSTVGAIGGRLQACNVRKSNCVCSQQPGGQGHVIAVLMQQANCHIAVNRPDYVHAEFTSDKLGFVDDVEFLLSQAEQVIHVRSASRLGLSDFGVNRARIETLREAFDEADD